MAVIVKTSVLKWLGVASIAFGSAVVFVVAGGWLEAALVWGLFGVLGFTLVLMSATIEATEEEITVRRVTSTARVRWADVVAASVGGGNLVLYTGNGRISLPASEFWTGPQRGELKVLIGEKLDGNGVAIRRTARAAIHVDHRSHNKSSERTRGE